MHEKMIGLGTIAVMLISLAVMASQGLGTDLGKAMLYLFSVTIAVGLLFLGPWFGEEE